MFGLAAELLPPGQSKYKFSSPDHRIAPHGQIGLGGSLVVEDLIKRFKKAVDEFSESPLFFEVTTIL